MSRSTSEVEKTPPENPTTNIEPQLIDLKSLADDESKKLNPELSEQPKKARGRPKKDTAPDINAKVSESVNSVLNPQPKIEKRSFLILIKKSFFSSERYFKNKYQDDYKELSDKEIDQLSKEVDDALGDTLVGLGLNVAGWVANLFILSVVVGVYIFEKYLVIKELKVKIEARIKAKNNQPVKAE